VRDDAVTVWQPGCHVRAELESILTPRTVEVPAGISRSPPVGSSYKGSLEIEKEQGPADPLCKSSENDFEADRFRCIHPR